MRPTVWPLAERLSQERTVKGAAPAIRRRASAATRNPGCRARRVGILQVMNDVGMMLVQVAGLRRVAVALLGDRQRDDARGRVSQARDQTAPGSPLQLRI